MTALAIPAGWRALTLRRAMGSYASALLRENDNALLREKDGAALAVFRIAFGVLVSVSAMRFFVYGWIDEFLLKPKFVFSYYGASFITRPPREILFAMFATLFVAGAMVALGLFYRIAIVTLFVLFSWIELLDVTNYLNHYYLVSLLALLASFMPLGEVYGLDGLRSAKSGRARRTTFPAWMTYLLRFQIAIVYFNAGLAKANADWLLHAQPLNLWLSARTGVPLLGPFLGSRAAAYTFSWAGFLFDATIWAFLLVPRTRGLAYLIVVAFHLTTSLLFPIGMFPFIMMVSALVFFSPSWPRALVAKLGGAFGVPGPSESSPASVSNAETAAAPAPRGKRFALGAAAAAVFCVIQVALPLRHRFYGGNVLWHEQGMRFSWKVMVREKNASVTYRVRDFETGREWEVHPRRYLDRRQEREFGGQPDLVVRLAHVIHDDETKRIGHEVEVRVDDLVSLNGRAAHPLIDPTVDLSRASFGLAPHAYILPAPEEPPPHLRPLL